MNYIISLKHTKKSDRFITLWRHNSNGYCWYKDWAGLYEDEFIGTHNDCSDMTISEQDIQPLFVELNYEGTRRTVLLNDADTHAALGVKFAKGTLLRIAPRIIKQPIG